MFSIQIERDTEIKQKANTDIPLLSETKAVQKVRSLGLPTKALFIDFKALC